MSHLRSCTLKIANMNPQILEFAMQQIARETNDTITQKVESYYIKKGFEGYRGSEHEQKVLIGLKNLGFGVNVVNGRLEVVGDEYKKSMTLEEFTTRVKVLYGVKAVQRELARKGYKTQIGLNQKTKEYQLVGMKN